MFRKLGQLVAMSVLALQLLSQTGAGPHGTVIDFAGNPVSNASVTIPALGLTVKTGAKGDFAIEAIAAEHANLVITAPGFAPLRIEWHSGDPQRSWRLALPAAEQRLTVTDRASARTLSRLNSSELEASPAPDLDTTLRRVPGFTLFRRTPSWSANPTAQGVSLRGVGASGASRAAVLLDGIPMNDPFGGWVYWGRLTPDSLQYATVAEGGASELYGTQAMGGVIELQRATRSATNVSGTAYLGNLFTPGGSVLAGHEFGRFWAGIGISSFRTNGYVPTAPAERGAVDSVASSENGSGWARLERSFGSTGRGFFAGDLYGESRHNGTRLQFNSATIRQLRTGLDWSDAALGDLSLRLYGGTENLRQTFSAVAPDRSTESLTRDQSVPASQFGLSATWSRTLGSRHMLLAGADAGRIEGDDREWVYQQLIRTGEVLSGGSQWRLAGFLQDRIRLSQRAMLIAGVRLDHWLNNHARTASILLTSTPPSETGFPDRSETFASPRLGIDFAARNNIFLHASISRAFRAPTLNELYRSFRVGNVLTLSNADLRSEQQTGAEAGATITILDRHSLTGTFFWNAVTDPVSNVTLFVTPALITRQRQNLGSLRSIGIETAWEAHWSDWASTSLAYQYANATVIDSPADSTLIGLWIPQVAHNNASAQLRFGLPDRFSLILGGRYQGLQFDDDRNQFRLGGYFVADAYASRSIRRNLSVFVAAENLVNRRYQVGRTPVNSLGPPILARVGIRFRLGEGSLRSTTASE